MKYISILVLSLFLFGCATNNTTENVVAENKAVTNNQTKQKKPVPQKANTKTQQKNTSKSSLTAQQKIQQQQQQRLKQQKNKAIAASNTNNGPGVSWVKIGAVEDLVKKKPKKVVVDVYTSWCGPCKMLDKTTFKDAEVVKLMSDNFYSVKFNAEGPDPVKFKGKTYTNPKYNPAKTRGRNGQHTLTPTFGIRGYPSIIILDEKMNIIDKASGYLRPAQMKAFLSKHV
mgnify:CR=1 FL=1